MRPPTCVACGLPVLELVGQSVTLPPYLSVDGSPPVDTAGSWHLPCLAADPVAGEWGHALVRNYVEVRGCELVATTSHWWVVRHPRTGDVLALGRGGATLPLNGPRLRHGPGTYRVSEEVYWLQWEEPAIREIQERLRRAGSMPVLEVAGQLGLRDRLSHPGVLADSIFRLDPELVEYWQPAVVGAPVDYDVYVPPELTPYCD